MPRPGRGCATGGSPKGSALTRVECQHRGESDSGRSRWRRVRPCRRDTTMPTTDDSRTDDSTAASGGLDARKAAILNAVVTEYIGSAQPVGSQHVVDAPGVSVSSATVRSDMAALERDGYLAQPHTSAGRIPTDKGYRFFVDHLARPGIARPGRTPAGPAVLRPRPRRDRADARADLGPPRRPHRLHGHGGRALPRVGRHPLGAAGRPGPPPGPAGGGPGRRGRPEAVRRVRRRGRRGPSGRRRPAAWPPTRSGGPLTQVRATAARTGDPATDAVVAAGLYGPALPSAPADGAEQLFVGGSSRMVAAFDAVDTVRSVLTHPRAAARRGHAAPRHPRPGLSVAIGTEHGMEPLASCAIVVMPVSVDGRGGRHHRRCSGPTRMNYPLALAAARVVGDRLGRRLSEAGR